MDTNTSQRRDRDGGTEKEKEIQSEIVIERKRERVATRRAVAEVAEGGGCTGKGNSDQWPQVTERPRKRDRDGER